MTAVVNLARERRIRGLMTDLRRMFAASPGLAQRTGAMLRGELAAPDLEEEQMVNEMQLSVRLPEDLLKRLEKMETKMAKNPELAAFRVSRQSVLRLALMRGLDVLEAEHAEKRGTR